MNVLIVTSYTRWLCSRWTHLCVHCSVRFISRSAHSIAFITPGRRRRRLRSCYCTNVHIYLLIICCYSGAALWLLATAIHRWCKCEQWMCDMCISGVYICARPKIWCYVFFVRSSFLVVNVCGNGCLLFVLICQSHTHSYNWYWVVLGLGDTTRTRTREERTERREEYGERARLLRAKAYIIFLFDIGEKPKSLNRRNNYVS